MLPFDLPLVVDWIGVAVGCAAIWHVQRLRRAGKTLDRAAKFFMLGIGIFVASLVWERFAEGFEGLGLPHEEPHHVLMMASMLTFAYAASRFVPSKDDLVKEIGERRKTQAALAESELKFRTLVEEAPVGINFLHADGKLLYMNRAGLEVMGTTLDRIKGDGWADFIHSDDKAEAIRTIRESFQARRGFSVDLRIVRPDGGIRWVHAQVNPVTIPGQPVEFISTFIDMTAAKESSTVLEQKKDELERTVRLMIGREKTMIDLKRKLGNEGKEG